MAETRRMCPHCRAFITTRDKVCPYCNAEVGPRAAERRGEGGLLGGFIPHARFTTSIILLINFGLFAATVLYSMSGGNSGAIMGLDGRTLVNFGAKWAPALAVGQWWRLVTAGFLHGGIMHLLMNSWALFDLGATVEELYGWARLVVIYFVATVFGFYASALWTPAVSMGASAGIFGLIGAMIALGLRSKTPMGAAIRSLYVRWAIYGLILGFMPFLAVDNAAHLGGLAAGFVAGYAGGTPKLVETAPAERLWRIAAWVSIGITAFCFVKMYQWFSSGGVG